MSSRGRIFQILSDLSPHRQEELAVVVSSGQLDSVLAGMTNKRFIVDGIAYWICEDETEAGVVYQLTPAFCF
jgi:hypothetical protein